METHTLWPNAYRLREKFFPVRHPNIVHAAETDSVKFETCFCDSSCTRAFREQLHNVNPEGNSAHEFALLLQIQNCAFSTHLLWSLRDKLHQSPNTLPPMMWEFVPSCPWSPPWPRCRLQSCSPAALEDCTYSTRRERSPVKAWTGMHRSLL